MGLKMLLIFLIPALILRLWSKALKLRSHRRNYSSQYFLHGVSSALESYILLTKQSKKVIYVFDHIRWAPKPIDYTTIYAINRNIEKEAQYNTQLFYLLKE